MDIEILDNDIAPCFEIGFMDENNKSNALYYCTKFRIINIYDEYKIYNFYNNGFEQSRIKAIINYIDDEIISIYNNNISGNNTK